MCGSKLETAPVNEDLYSRPSTVTVDDSLPPSELLESHPPDSFSMAREQTGTRRRRAAKPNSANSTSTTAAAAAPQTQDGAARQEPPSVREAVKQILVRSVLMYALYQYYLKPKTQPQQLDSRDLAEMTKPGPQATNPIASLLGTHTGPVPRYYSVQLNPAWKAGAPLQMRVYATMISEMSFRDALRKGDEDLVWSLDHLDLSTSQSNYLSKNFTLQVPPVVWERNTTWYAHIFVASDNLFNADADSVSGDMIEKHVLHTQHQFVTWLKVDLTKKGKSLLGSDHADESNETVEESRAGTEKPSETGFNGGDGENHQPSVRYDQVYKPTMPIWLVVANGALMLSQLPPPAAEKFRVSPESRLYFPPLEVNEFWMLRDTLPPMNDTVPKIKVEVSLVPISLYKWSMYKQFDNVWRRQIGLGMMRPEETDDLKRMFIETNPVLLATTTIVSVAHTVLEALAFKNDISHWKNIKSMEGVSVRSMIWKIVMEAIIFLYLWDNETSWMITVGNAVGLAIAVWKLGKAVKFENFGKRKLLGFIPWFEVSDRESYSKETKEYDDIAMKYLGYALYPLVAGYALYSLKYERHKSWYSWIINSLVGAVYAFGFIMMFPQIFINYKLKSVAHMPMKAMMYKTLNTIIDDLFSFIIKMPWLHRLACFRDDVVFLIILYQRWIYPVDKSRVNEFGQQFEENGEEKKNTEAESKETEDSSIRAEPDKSEERSEPVSEAASEVSSDAPVAKPDVEKKND